MKYYRKLKQIRRYSHSMKLAQMQSLLLQQNDLYSSYLLQNGANGSNGSHGSKGQEDEGEEEDSSLEGEEGEGGEDGEEMDDFNITDYIGSLPNKLKRQFRNSNPQLPDIFFMSKLEKKKYFDNINLRFKKSLKMVPQRTSKNKKTLKFSNQFEVRPFDDHQKVVALKNSKKHNQPYSNQVHFS